MRHGFTYDAQAALQHRFLIQIFTPFYLFHSICPMTCCQHLASQLSKAPSLSCANTLSHGLTSPFFRVGEPHSSQAGQVFYSKVSGTKNHIVPSSLTVNGQSQ